MQTYLERCAADSILSREEFAAFVWQCRNLPKEDRKHPQWVLTYPHQPIGFYLRGRGSFWVPHPQEVRPCCQVLNLTSQHKYPWVYHRHCRTLRHIAMLLNVDEGAIRQRVKIPQCRCSCGKFRKSGEYVCRNCK